MAEPCIISVAITGSVPRKRDNPALPVTITEQIESTHAAYEAGAALVHVHVRNAEESPHPTRRIRRLPGGHPQALPGHHRAVLHRRARPGAGAARQHAAPAAGHGEPGHRQRQLPDHRLENPPDFVRSLATTMRDLRIKPEIEVFDLAMLYNTADLVARG